MCSKASAVPQPDILLGAPTCHMAFLLACLQMSVDAMLDKCASNTSLSGTRNMMLALKNTIAVFNLTMTTYEAGPSIVEAAVLSGTSGGTAGAADK
jgi:hypothetical protein